MKKLIKPVVEKTTNDAYALCGLGKCEPVSGNCSFGACDPLTVSKDEDEDEILF